MKRHHNSIVVWKKYFLRALLLLVLSTLLFTRDTVDAHNLDASAVYVYFDPDTQAMLDARISGGWSAGTPLLQIGDEVGVIIKTVPDNGTTTGVGGYTTFYVPNGVQVTDVAFLSHTDLAADGVTGYDKIPVKGQALMPHVGAGGGPTVSLVGMSRGPNVVGATANLVNAANVNNGTLPGVYGDLGIFYSTAPETAYGTYTGGTIKNNSGDIVGLRTPLGTPLNAWDAWQMAAFGIAGTTNPAYPAVPLLDSNGRGNTGWGLANAVAGPQSGYAWEFDKTTYDGCDPTPTATPVAGCLDLATQSMGPWQRIQYPGSQIAYDIPGDIALGKFAGGINANGIGYNISSSPLPATTGQGNGTPNAIRFAFGQLTLNKPEFAWVKMTVNDYSAILDPSGCPIWRVDTFGGDAGGDDNGKDHIWRYYDPNSVLLNGCLAIGKPATRDIVKVGDTYQYQLQLYNVGNNDLTNVVVTDLLPTGVTFISSVPPQTSGPNPLRWVVGTIPRGRSWKATVTVRASSSGILQNSMTATATPAGGGPDITATTTEKTVSGLVPLLVQSKSVTPATIAPGGVVAYTVRIDNIGTGPTGNPIIITDYLPDGFTYAAGGTTATVNGATVTPSVNSSDLTQPIFTIPAGLQANNFMLLTFNAQVSAVQSPGSYCNSYTSSTPVNQTTGALACVNVGGGQIGDTIYRDWNNSGSQDAGEEGLAGVTVTLRDGSNNIIATTVTDANGNYLFTGLTAGTYTVQVPAAGSGGVPTGYALSGDPDGGPLNLQFTLVLASNQQYLTADFGYLPGGSGTIGDLVFDDRGNDGNYNPGLGDVGIPNITVNLYEDTNGNGIRDVGDVLVATTTTGINGLYSFTGLAEGISYLVDVDENDPDLDTYFSSNPYVLTTIDPHPVANLTGSYTLADFGFYEVIPGSIGDQVFIDNNQNGIYDAGTDLPLPAVTVYLYQDTNNNGVIDVGEPLLATTVTDANGNYSFNNLPAGNYLVDVDENSASIPDGYLPTIDLYGVTLAEGENVTNIDFPFVAILQKAVDLTVANPLDPLNFTLTPYYPGPELLSNVVVQDTVPAGTTFVTVGQGGTHSAGTVSWSLGSNTAGAPGAYSNPGAALCPVTVTLYPVADTYIDLALPNSNFGTIATFRTRPANATSYNYGLIRFNTSSLTGLTIKSARLGLTVATGRNNHFDTAYRMTTAWTETGATWNDSDGAGAGDWSTGTFSAADYAAGALGGFVPYDNVAMQADVTAAVSSWASGTTNNGFALISTGTDAGDAVYRSREDGGAATTNDPYLQVTYMQSTPGGCNGGAVTTTPLTSIADTYVDINSPTTLVGFTTEMRTRPAAADRLQHALVSFDLSSIPAGATISNATLELYVTTARATNHTDRVHVMATPWIQGGASWDDSNAGLAGDWSAGTFGAGDYNAASLGNIVPSTTGLKTLNVTGAVNNWVNGAVNNNGFVLLSTGTDAGEARYATRENGTVAQRPILRVQWQLQATPEPTTNVSLSTVPVLAAGVSQIEVTMVATSDTSIATVTPPASLTVSSSNVASVVLNSGPTPATASAAPGSPAIFTYVYNVTAGAVPGSVTFSGAPTSGTATFTAGTSNSVLITPPLTFQVTVNDPPGVDVILNQGQISDSGSLSTIVSNETETALTASVGDYVWIDSDTDGIQDATEAGLANVRVFIDTNGNGVWDIGEPNDITDGFGNYRIYGLSTGSYDVLVDLTSLPAGYQPTTATSHTAVLATDIDQYSAADFGFRPPASGSIGDTVWLDSDNDGVFDVGEAGLAGVTVNLEMMIGGNWVVVASTTTDANGNYIFEGLYAGDYRVTVDETSSVTSTLDPSVTSTIGASMSPTTGTTNPVLVTLATDNTVIDTVDFGYNWSGSIGDYAWYDSDVDSVPDTAGDEGGAPNTTIVLYYDSDGDGEINTGAGDFVVAVAVTDGTGFYTFGDLPPGDYIVKAEEQQVPAPPSSANAGQIGFMIATTGSEHALSLAAGEVYTTADFGFVEAAEVEGHVFHDADRDGIYAGETTFVGVQVSLTGFDINGNPVSLSTVTDASGEYKFIVPPGNYTITYSQADVLGIDPDMTDVTTLSSYSFGVNAGQELGGFDFGVDHSGVIGDWVWNDANGDGLQTAGEIGLPNVTVNLYASDGTTLLAIAVTDANGYYSFPGLDDGTYFVEVDPTTVPTGYAQTFDNDGALDHRGQATLSGTDILTVDFGYYNNVAYNVSGTVWDDVDGSGTQNTEPGLSGVTVCLYDSGNVLVACTVTDGSGNYLFPGIPNGNYTIAVVDTTLPNNAYTPTYDADGTGTPNVIAITINNGNVSNQNFGYQEQLGSITGTICEGTGDGLCDDPGDITISGVTVFLIWAGPDGLIGTADDEIQITTTDGSGNYSFTDLLPGFYQITKMNPAGYISLADADGSNPSNVYLTLGVNENAVDQDFELQQTLGSIGDTVWLDVDGDGIQDVGESGLANVTVELYGVGPDGNPGGGDDVLLATAVTDANGNYLFSNIGAGDYYVAVDGATLPAGLTPSAGSYMGAEINLLAGDSYLQADFGYVPVAGTAVIGDFVWADANGDGIQDAGEIGIAGVTVELRNSSGTVIATTTTGPDGSYYFTNVAPGNYTVAVTPPAGYTVTSGPESEGANVSQTIAAVANAVITNIDFGFDNPALWSISDRLWYDADQDGIFDAGESGLGGVSVSLLDDSGNVIATVISNPDGTFTFSGVPNGDYTIQIDDNSNQLGNYQPTTTGATVGSTSVTMAGADINGTSFGYVGLGPIGDTVWSDSNGNGVQDLGELGIAGVTVELFYDSNGNGTYDPGTDALLSTQITDASGNYLFTDLPVGTFFVVVTPPAGYTQTGDPDGVVDDMTSITLTVFDTTYMDADFGYQNTALPEVSGSIWNDINRNGVDDGANEPPLGGVTVALLDSSGNVVATAVTDASGDYIFYDVPAGDYVVAVTDDNNILLGYQLSSGLDAIPVTVSGTDVTDVDFAYVRDPATGVIGDRVWFDSDWDGIQDGPEAGIANVDVLLKAAVAMTIDGVFYNAGDTIATATTDMNGNYLFAGLPAGSYTVDVDAATLPAGLTLTTGSSDPLAVELGTGQIYLRADFGYIPATGSALGDVVWHDANSNGLQDPGEVGLANVDINVEGPSCPAGCTVTTDADGSWLITGLASGSYTVTVVAATLPAGYVQTYDLDGVLDHTIVVNVMAMREIMFADFGYQIPSATGVIGDRIWLDANGDGSDAGEDGIQGVTVNLLDGSGNIIATTTTDGNGNYQFIGLPDGNYSVQVSDIGNVLADLIQTYDPDATIDGATSVSVSGGVGTLDADFGYQPSGGAIGNQLWHDLDGDGTRDAGEPGIEGVSIALWVDANNNGVIEPGIDNLVRTTLTDDAGQYQFAGLPAGNYLVNVSDIYGVLTGMVPTSGIANTNNESQSVPYAVTLTNSGGVVSTNYTADFGYEAVTPLAISGLVFHDMDSSGGWLVGEPLVPGATVALYREINGELFLMGTTVSNGSGFYEFTNLPAGDYQIVTDVSGTFVSGYFQTTQLATNSVQFVTLSTANSTNNNFGYNTQTFVPTAIALQHVTVNGDMGNMVVTSLMLMTLIVLSMLSVVSVGMVRRRREG